MGFPTMIAIVRYMTTVKVRKGRCCMILCWVIQTLSNVVNKLSIS
jgi:hypothetical protein